MPTNYTKIKELVDNGIITEDGAIELYTVTQKYSLSITPTMLELMKNGEKGIINQFLPTINELESLPYEKADPIGDFNHSPLKGLVHRYNDRVLIKITHTCPVYCRFCFRREMVGKEGNGNLNQKELDEIFDYIENNPQIFEVIFTGGDPLIISERRIIALGERLSSIKHVKLVRWHSRVPVVSPKTITDSFVIALKFKNKANYIAIHINHPSELTNEAIKAINLLGDNGISLLGQTVLLKNINDDRDILIELFKNMVANRIKPLYLHHPDLAPGTKHFRMSLSEGRKIYESLSGVIPGHAIPRYVIDIPGGYGKVPVSDTYIITQRDGSTMIKDMNGNLHKHEENT